jgi:hypothetical protein
MSKLNILWTNASEITADKMVFMYAINSLRLNWWDEVQLIIWGEPAKLITTSDKIRQNIIDAKEAGVHVTACKKCADDLGATDTLLELGVEVIYWGEGLTKILKDDEKLLTV